MTHIVNWKQYRLAFIIFANIEFISKRQLQKCLGNFTQHQNTTNLQITKHYP